MWINGLNLLMCVNSRLICAVNVPIGSESSLSCNEVKRLPDGDTFTPPPPSGWPGSLGETRSQSLDMSVLPRSTVHELQSHKRAWHLTAGPGWTKVKSAGFVKALWGQPPPPPSLPLPTLTHTTPMAQGGKCPEGLRGDDMPDKLVGTWFPVFHLFSGRTWKSCSDEAYQMELKEPKVTVQSRCDYFLQRHSTEVFLSLLHQNKI